MTERQEDIVPEVVTRLKPDGSDRMFYRVLWNGHSAIRMNPAPGLQGIREARSFFLIGSHLFQAGLPVPEIFEYDPETGVLIVEDLGDLRLFDLAVKAGENRSRQELLDVYEGVVETLFEVQQRATPGFSPEWCWQGGHYDLSLCVEKEGGYFSQALLQGYLGVVVLPALAKSFRQEVEKICTLVLSYGAKVMGPVFLHRDFQSRNIMFSADNKPHIIDFQGARLGPRGYDLAALIHDPYVDLPWELRHSLLHHFTRLCFEDSVTRSEFQEAFWHLSLMRLFQAAGAYGYLSQIKGRSFFEKFIGTALDAVDKILSMPLFSRFEALPFLVQQAREKIKNNGVTVSIEGKKSI